MLWRTKEIGSISKETSEYLNTFKSKTPINKKTMMTIVDSLAMIKMSTDITEMLR